MCRIRSLMIIAIFCCATTTFALNSDKSEVLHISADAVVYNYKTGVNLYEGHVNVAQGTTHLLADKLITKSNHQHKIQEAIAYGNETLAHYWTIPKPDDAELHAYAKIIKYYPIEANVTLEQEVTVKQGENSFLGQLIHYNSEEQTITVPPAQGGHAVLVYDPEK